MPIIDVWEGAIQNRQGQILCINLNYLKTKASKISHGHVLITNKVQLCLLNKIDGTKFIV